MFILLVWVEHFLCDNFCNISHDHSVWRSLKKVSFLKKSLEIFWNLKNYRLKIIEIIEEKNAFFFDFSIFIFPIFFFYFTDFLFSFSDFFGFYFSDFFFISPIFSDFIFLIFSRFFSPKFFNFFQRFIFKLQLRDFS